MDIWLIKNNTQKNKYNITNMVTSFTWSGSVDEASRVLEFSVPNAPLDKAVTKLPSVSIGDFIKLFDDNNFLIYYGMVYESEKTSEVGEVRFTSRDLLFHFTKSSWNMTFKNTTAEAIALRCCNEVGVSAGNIIATNIAIKKLIADNESIFDTLIRAYRLASKSNSKKYLAKMSGTKLDVIEKGKATGKILLSDNSNILNASISESISNMVNRVKIYNDKGVQTGVVENANDIGKYGVFQGTYKEQKGVNSKTAALEDLKNAEQTIEVECVGDIACISGYSIPVSDNATKLTGDYWISEDSHTFENGTHTMRLKLTFKNLMSKAGG